MRVLHNQNANLRPNDKMVREVCARCHGLPFTLDALADANLVRRNFAGAPGVRNDSIHMALTRKPGPGTRHDEDEKEDERKTP